MTILSKVAFYGTREERDYLISSVLWLLQYSEVNSIVTALRCLCDIAQEVDEFVTFEIISQSYSRIQELFNNKEYSSNFIIMRRTAKLMRLCINKFSETRMTSGIDTPTMTKLNEFIISWSSISLCWIEQSINSVSTIEHNLAVLLEIFKFLEISLETFPESGVVHNNKTLILSLQLLSVVRDQILAQQSCSIFDTDNTNYTSDGDRVDFEVLVIQLFEVLGVGVGYLSYQDLHIVVKDNLKAIVNMVYEFMRLSPTQIDMWLNDSNRFLYEEQDESFEFHIRQSGHELISQLCRVAKEDAYNPFFTCTKEEIMKYLDSHQLAWIQPQQSHVLRTIGFIISDNIHENATNKQLLWVEGILWSLAAVGKSYMRVINKEKKERKSKVTDASGVKSDDGLSVNSNDTNEFKRRKRKYHSILTAIPPADVTKFIVHALGTLSENTVSVFLRGRALTVYCTFVSLCDISITKGMFYSCIDLLLSSESFTPKMQACRALGLLIYRGTRKFDSNDNSNYNGSMRFEDYMSSAENTLLANNYAQNITNNINNINRVGGTLLYNRSDQDLTAANNNSSGSSNHTILGGSSTNKNSIFTNILNSVKDMIANVDENTVHFVVETLKEMVRKFPNSLILNDVYLICTICMMLWENFMKDSFVIEILKDTLISVAKLPNGIGCKGLYEKFLPFLSDFFNDKSFGNHSIDRNGGMNISGNNGYETNYPSSYNNGNVSMIPIESAYALIARVFAVTRSTYFESARLAKMQILVMLTMNLNRPQLKAYQREILQSLNEIFSSCYYHNEPIETFFRSEDQIKEFCASINSTILEAFVDVDGDFCSTERIGPAIGLMFHSILNCSKYADDRDHIKIIGNALHLILTTNSKYVKYSLVMGFVQLFAHNAEIIMHLLNLVPPANGYNDNIELILGLWFKLHPKLFSRYNGTISTIGLLSILQFSTMDKVNHEFARKVLHVILERLPYILTKGSDSSVIGELNYQDLDRYNNNNDDDYDEDDNEDENSTNTVSDSTMDPYDEYWDGEIVNDENSASDSIATTKFNNPRTDTSDLGAYSPSEMYLSDMIPPPISVVNVPIGGNNSNNSLMNSLNLSNNTNSSNTNINSLTGNNANYTDQSGKQFKNDDELEQDELVFVNVSDNLVFMPATADSLAGNADIEAMLVEILRNQKSSGCQYLLILLANCNSNI